MNLVLPLLLICIPSSVALVRCVFPSDLISSQDFWKNKSKAPLNFLLLICIVRIGFAMVLMLSANCSNAAIQIEWENLADLKALRISVAQGTTVFCGNACTDKNTFYIQMETTFYESDSYLIGFPETGGCPNIPFDCKANLTFYGPYWTFKKKTYLDSAAKCCESVGENCLENAPEFVTSSRRTKPTKPKRTTTRPLSTTTAATTTKDPKRPNATRLFKHDHDYDSRQQVGLLITVYSAIVAVLCGGAAIAFALEIWSYMARK